MINKIAHIAIAVNDLDKEIERYRDILGLDYLGMEVVEKQKVKVAFFKVGETQIELTAPTEWDSPVGKFLKKRGSGIHHIAYEVDDVENQIKEFKEKGVRMIDETSRLGAEKAKIAFVHPEGFSGVLIELKEK
jgi:methylmalonyl-CoA/ethylmalonyl-CoA epimerase